MWKPEVEPKFSAKCIAKAVRRIAAEIAEQSDPSGLVLVGVVQGGIPFLADLLREFHACKPNSGVQVALANVHSGQQGQGSICEWLPPKDHVQGRNAIIVEDIVSKGETITILKRELRNLDAKSVKVCSMLYQHHSGKPLSGEPVEYSGFKVEDFRWVGYGLDIGGGGRDWADIYGIDAILNCPYLRQ